MNKFTCPICGFNNLDKPAWDPVEKTPGFDICPCCGCEFGYDDATPQAGERYRLSWIKKGAEWFVPHLKPSNWNLQEQLSRINIDLDKLK